MCRRDRAGLVRDAGLRAEVAAAAGRLGDGEALADAIWSIREDRLATAAAVADLLGADAVEATEDVVAGWWAIQVALSALDRLEVRGRDSAGVAVMVTAADSPDGPPGASDPLGRSGSRWRDAGATVHVHKTAVEVGELGHNTRVLREALAGDGALRAALARPGARCVVLAHTRWASVGLITEPNAHPVASLSADGEPWVLAAVNGDIDNYGAIVGRFDLSYPAAVTTDARVAPGLARRLRSPGRSDRAAFAAAVASFEGSHAIVSLSSDSPGNLLLARRGSGQALYVGLAPDCFVVASEPYGLVEQTGDYLRFDGADAADSGNGVARSYGLTFRMTDDVQDIYRDEFRIDLARFNGDLTWELPLPATYVVGRDGVVVWAGVDVDYTRRPEPEGLLGVLDGMD